MLTFKQLKTHENNHQLNNYFNKGETVNLTDQLQQREIHKRTILKESDQTYSVETIQNIAEQVQAEIESKQRQEQDKDRYLVI